MDFQSPYVRGDDGKVTYRELVFLDDYPIRTVDNGLLVGDHVRMRNGQPGTIIAIRNVDGVEYICAVPDEMIDEERKAKILNGDYQ